MDEIVIRAIVVLWRSREFDTRDIADVVVESEATVATVIAEAQAGQRDFVEVVTDRHAPPFAASSAPAPHLSAPAPHPGPLPSGERGQEGGA